MKEELLSQLKKYDLEYDLEYEFGIVENINNGLVDILLSQRNFRYKDCILLGNYNPIVNESGILIFVSNIKYPCFLPLFFANNQGEYNPNDTIFQSKGEFVANTNNLESDFLIKVSELCNRLQINDNDLLLVMNFESNFNPKAVNQSSNATGLIQFLPSTAISLGTTVQELYNLNRVEQLKYVEKYLSNIIQSFGQLKNLQDMCMSVFYPSYIGKPIETIFSDKVRQQNKGIVSIQDYVNLVLKKSNRKSGTIKMSEQGTISLEQ